MWEQKDGLFRPTLASMQGVDALRRWSFANLLEREPSSDFFGPLQPEIRITKQFDVPLQVLLRVPRPEVP